MGVSYERVHRVRRPHHLRKAAHLAEIGDAHLDHRRFVLRLDAEYSKRYAKLVVEIFIRFKHVKSLRQNRRDHFLCRSFSDRACYSDDRDAECIPVFLGEPCHGLCGAVNDDQAALYIEYVVLDNAACRTKLKRLANIIVSVYSLTGDRGKCKFRLDKSAVDHKAAKFTLNVAFSGQLAADNGCRLLNTYAPHSYFSMESLIIFSQTSPKSRPSSLPI